MRHRWKNEGAPLEAVARSCEACGATGRRFRARRGYTRWETRLPGSQAWVPARVPPCPGQEAGTPERLLKIAPGQQWLTGTGNVIRVTRVDDDLIAYERVSGNGRPAGTLRARSLIQYYAEAVTPWTR